MKSTIITDLITMYDEKLKQPVYVIKETKISYNTYWNKEKEYLCSICGEKFITKMGTVISRGHVSRGYGKRYYCVKCADILGMWKNT